MRVFGNAPLLPVKVWQDLTADSECHNPRGFTKEVLDVEKISRTGGCFERFFEHLKSLLKTRLFR